MYLVTFHHCSSESESQNELKMKKSYNCIKPRGAAEMGYNSILIRVYKQHLPHMQSSDPLLLIKFYYSGFKMNHIVGFFNTTALKGGNFPF